MKNCFTRVVFLTLAIALASVRAFANSVNTAKVTENCTSYTITLNFAGMVVGQNYTATWQINGLGQVINDQTTFTAQTANITMSITRTWAS